jgi:hypothetical protein
VHQQISSSKNSINSRFLWHISVACFILASLTGFLYRLGMLGWIPTNLSLDNIRHAHSHLMFFGWAVPLPFYIIMQKIVGKADDQVRGINWMKYSIGATLFFGLLAYPFFLFYGYRPVSLGAAPMPLSVIFSGFVMISWYGFMIGYWKSRVLLKNEDSLPWIDGALILLAVCSIGAWGVAVIQEVAPDSHLLMKSMTHFFLAVFTEGWVVLILLAILISELEINLDDWPISPQLALGVIAIGAPLTFPYGISESLLSPMLLGTARFGGGLAAIGLLIVLTFIFKVGKWKHLIWIWPILLLLVKGILQLGSSVIPSSFWLSDPGLRVLYLHILLLGGLTLLGLGWLQSRSSIKRKYFYTDGIAVIITLVTLFIPTKLWPGALSGSWIFYGLAIGALLPILAVSIHWLKLR